MKEDIHVLIVEDEQGIVDNIVFILQQEGFTCSHAPTVGQARHIMDENEISVVILDIGLPDEDGFTFCRELRKASDVPIIFLSARSDVTDRIVGLELGADDYMVKPFSPRELSARVKAILRRNQKTSALSDVSCDIPFEIDQDKRQVRYFGVALDLARYEFDILNVMLRYPGRVFSREEILDAVWDEPGSSYDRTVDTHIKVIRTKLHAVREGVTAIVTHRGSGYAIREQW